MKPAPLTPEDLRAKLDRLNLSQVGAAKIVGVDDRTMRRWLAPTHHADGSKNDQNRDIPGPVLVLLDLLERFPAVRAYLVKSAG